MANEAAKDPTFEGLPSGLLVHRLALPVSFLRERISGVSLEKRVPGIIGVSRSRV